VGRFNKKFAYNRNGKEGLIISIIGLIIFRLSLDYASFQLFNEMYRMGTSFAIDLVFYKYCISILVVLILSIFVVKIIRRKTLSRIVFFILFLLSYLPGTSLYGLIGLPDQYFLYFNIYWILFSWAIMCIPRIKMMRLDITGNSYYIFYYVVVVASFIAVGYSYYYTGFRFVISLEGMIINSLRTESYDFLTGGSVYLLFWIANIIIPLAIVHFLNKKQWLLLCSVIFIQIMLFSINGTKTWLLLIPVSIIGALFYKEKVLKYTAITLAIVNFAGVWLFKGFGLDFFTNMITRRMFFSQALSNYLYYDFFLTNPKDMLMSSLLRWFGATSQYTTPIQRIIGYVYYHAETVASSGLFADAYSNFGLFGVIIYPIFLVIFLKIFESLAEGINIKDIISILIVISVYLLNGSFFTVFLTYGLLAGMLIVLIYPRNNDIPNNISGER
jgi:hypothetical protein